MLIGRSMMRGSSTKVACIHHLWQLSLEMWSVVHLIKWNLLECSIIHLLLHLFTFLICCFGQVFRIYLSVRNLWILLINLILMNLPKLIYLFQIFIRISRFWKLWATYEEFWEFWRKRVAINIFILILTLADHIALSLCNCLKNSLCHHHWVFLLTWKYLILNHCTCGLLARIRSSNLLFGNGIPFKAIILWHISIRGI